MEFLSAVWCLLESPFGYTIFQVFWILLHCVVLASWHVGSRPLGRNSGTGACHHAMTRPCPRQPAGSNKQVCGWPCCICPCLGRTKPLSKARFYQHWV